MDSLTRPHAQTIDGVISGLGAATIWGGLYVVSRVVLDTVPPITLVFIRLVLGTLTLAVVSWVAKPDPNSRLPSQRSRRRAWGHFVILGFVGMCVSLVAQFAGTHLAGAANGSLITSATPAFMLLFAWPLNGARPTARQWASLAVATVGVLVVTLGGATDVGDTMTNALAGNLFLILAAVTWALYSVLAGRASAQYGTLVTTGYATATGALCTLPLVPWELTTTAIGELHWQSLLGVAYIGIASTAGAFYLWNRSIERLGPALPGLLFFAQPVVGALLGATVLGEPLSSAFFVGGGLVVIGVILGLREA